MPHKMSLKSLALVAVCLLLLTACGGTGGGGGGGGNPADAAKAFFEAVFAGKGDPAPLICKSGGDAFKKGMESMKAGFAASGGTVDVSGLKFETANQTGDSADVKVTGKIKVSAGGQSMEQDFPPNVVVKMKNEGGWKVCG